MRTHLIFLLAMLGPGFSLQIAKAAAPQCSVTLISEVTVTKKQVDAAIQDIARLKLNIDITKANGTANSMPIKFLVSAYNKKLNELLTAVNGQMTESNIKAAIQDQIQDLQGLRKIAKEKEAKVASQKYELKSIVKIDSLGDIRKARYAPAINTLISIRGSNWTLSLTDLKTGKTSALIDNCTDFWTTSDGDLMVFLTTKGEYMVYDLVLKNVLHRETVHSGYLGKAILNPNTTSEENAWFATAISTISLHNFETKKPFPFPTKHAELWVTDGNHLVKSYAFAGPDVIVYVREQEQLLRWIDLNTGEMHKVPTEVQYKEIFTSEDGKVIGLWSHHRISFIETAQLKNFDLQVIHNEFTSAEYSTTVQFVGNSQFYISHKAEQLEPAIYSIFNSLQQPFKFNSDGHDESYPVFSDKGDQAFFIGESQIELWQK